MPNPKDFLPPPPWEGPPIPRTTLSSRYRLVKRSRRGSLVTIEKVGNKATIDVASYEDMNDLTHLLNAARVEFKMSQSPKHAGHGWRVEFDFSDLEKAMAVCKKNFFLV